MSALTHARRALRAGWRALRGLEARDMTDAAAMIRWRVHVRVDAAQWAALGYGGIDPRSMPGAMVDETPTTSRKDLGWRRAAPPTDDREVEISWLVDATSHLTAERIAERMFVRQGYHVLAVCAGRPLRIDDLTRMR